ncbi:GlxA family transcriptional regulator [Marinobacter zhejiangensis]|uniref:Transcriptional regulator, AraC family with amidase-like domain n=1 Tax=Marinobacter zhejiangensis TaxID=488535 RepID=A0A1I4LIW3_9GAMM|nr:helix-turn-helix domain-containing protein [Marinobacter zhejiangensis]SFL91048.1 transcriptional regulator, AraC family with amidase-like domain [Marinobacter zhejiangensis]
MIKVAVVALPNCHASGVYGVMDFLATANYCAHLPGQAATSTFDCQLVTLDDQPVRGYSGVLVVPTCERASFQPDVIVLGSGGEAVASPQRLDQSLRSLTPLFPWLQAAYQRGAVMASVCTGSFVLAEAGLLDGQVATTHWRAASLFRKRYPTLRLDEEQLLVDNGQVICAGGANAFVDLCLYLVERLASPALALACSKLLVMDNRRSEQMPYMSFFGHKAHNDTAVKRAQEWLEQHYSEPVVIDEVAEVAGLGHRTFKRRFKEATGETPLSYLQQLRVEAAKHLLESSREQTAQIIWQVGYEDASSFRRLFKRTVGCTMEQYRRRFSYVASAVSPVPSVLSH